MCCTANHVSNISIKAIFIVSAVVIDHTQATRFALDIAKGMAFLHSLGFYNSFVF